MTTLSDFQAFAPCETTPCTHTYQANLADTPWCHQPSSNHMLGLSIFVMFTSGRHKPCPYYL